MMNSFFNSKFVGDKPIHFLPGVTSRNDGPHLQSREKTFTLVWFELTNVLHRFSRLDHRGSADSEPTEDPQKCSCDHFNCTILSQEWLSIHKKECYMWQTVWVLFKFVMRVISVSWDSYKVMAVGVGRSWIILSTLLTTPLSPDFTRFVIEDGSSANSDIELVQHTGKYGTRACYQFKKRLYGKVITMIEI